MIGLDCCPGLRLRAAGNLATGVEVINASAVVFVAPNPPVRPPNLATASYAVEVSLDGGDYWVGTQMRITYLEAPSAYDVAPTVIMYGQPLTIRIGGHFTFAGDEVPFRPPFILILIIPILIAIIIDINNDSYTTSYQH